MDQLSESSRRAFLAALAASGVGAAAIAAPDVAHAQGVVGPGVGGATPFTGGTPETFVTEAFPTPTPGTQYRFILGGDFLPLQNIYQFDKSEGQVQCAALSYFYFSLSDLPQGARVTEVTFAVVKSAASSGSGMYRMFHMSVPPAQLAEGSNAGLLTTVAAVEQYVTPAIDRNDPRWVVDNQQAASIWIALELTNSRVNSVRVGYVAPAVPPAFFPIAPKRVYDSRFVAPLGPLASATNRVILVANGYATDSATLDLPNVVPAGATAIAYNVTIANTIGAGYLSVNPGDATVLGGSSINWFTSGLSLANGLVVKLDANRQIKVFCGPGGGSADFIIDVLGYYL